jgi:AraC-like DNA-binding protein
VRQVASAYAGMVAAAYKESTYTHDRVPSRYSVITQSFRDLLSQYYKEDKSPAGYADRLHLSVNYLNEAVRAETGLPVRHWIQHTVMLEAKRLLYYTPLSVKEVAHTLGYDDHAYFTRLFTKVIGTSPLAFRRQQQGKALQEKYI